MKAILFVALAFAVAVYAQHERHCDAPFEFESHAFTLDHKEHFARRGHFAYDAREERTSFFEEVRNGTSDDAFHVIHLFREHRAFRFNLRTKTCTVEEIKHHFHRIEIPHEAHFHGDAIIGTSAFENSGLLTTHWSHEDKSAQTAWFGVFTDRDIGCIPVSDDFNDAQIGHVTSTFFDTVLGIADPDVFVPEKECKREAARLDAAKARRHHH